ncbi:MAG: hypothetical protein DRP93_03475 [Candidatus Neomarinimicrobiota bacterium]|nr:MAG: hypothetical protein DRP93_03475 [Candidatus Neomarinimicrobiota bacterium]
MRHPKLIAWEKKLKSVLDEIDILLEDRYGDLYDLHPARRENGTTSNRSHDGLFDIRGDFTLGYGSKKGRGYIINIDLKTLENVSKEAIENIKKKVVYELNCRLPRAFPDKKLKVEIDGNMIKIIGDLSLGNIS